MDKNISLKDARDRKKANILLEKENGWLDILSEMGKNNRDFRSENELFFHNTYRKMRKISQFQKKKIITTSSDP